jgi:hypothetical protein
MDYTLSLCIKCGQIWHPRQEEASMCPNLKCHTVVRRYIITKTYDVFTDIVLLRDNKEGKDAIT